MHLKPLFTSTTIIEWYGYQLFSTVPDSENNIVIIKLCLELNDVTEVTKNQLCFTLIDESFYI